MLLYNYIRNFWRWRTSQEEIPPKELNAYIGEFIITVPKKDSNEDKTMSPSPYVLWRPVLNGI